MPDVMAEDTKNLYQVLLETIENQHVYFVNCKGLFKNIINLSTFQNPVSLIIYPKQIFECFRCFPRHKYLTLKIDVARFARNIVK